MVEIHHKSGHVIYVDDQDDELAKSYAWVIIKKHNVFYAVRNKYAGGGRANRKTFRAYMHREIMGNPNVGHVDHINGNGLDNRRSNLRVVSARENAFNRGKQANNTSGFKGVWWHKQRRKWASTIRTNGKSHHLGLFDTPEAASEAYQAALLRFAVAPYRALVPARPRTQERREG